jgi:hypothetical protein
MKHILDLWNLVSQVDDGIQRRIDAAEDLAGRFQHGSCHAENTGSVGEDHGASHDPRWRADNH